MLADWQKWNAVDHMNKARNGRAASGGATQKARALKRPDPAAGSWAMLLGTTRASWDCWAGDAIENYRFEVFGHEWEGL